MRVRVVAPSRALPQEAADLALRLAEEFPRVQLEIDDQSFAAEGHFAGSDEVRAAAFVRAANDPDVDAVWLARGGYGACRILDKVIPAFSNEAKDKIVCGYSDGGFLLGALDRADVGRPVHASMVADGLREGGDEALRRVLTFFSSDADPEPACVFNLAVLSSLVASPHCPDFRDRIVVIEEIDEHLYAIDRALFTLFASGRLEGCAGLKLGRVLGVPENDIAFGETPERMVRRWCSAYGITYLGEADVGHDADNQVIPFRRHR
ncbi:MAG: LD-carboxypeptidase [Parvularculaceae bacterium]|nr:LD-carboxypeptidase [Parvularculaceae bacterium]